MTMSVVPPFLFIVVVAWRVIGSSIGSLCVFEFVWVPWRAYLGIFGSPTGQIFRCPQIVDPIPKVCSGAVFNTFKACEKTKMSNVSATRYADTYTGFVHIQSSRKAGLSGNRGRIRWETVTCMW